jgi:hypothetical protein
MAMAAALTVFTMPIPNSRQTASNASLLGSISGPHFSIVNWPSSTSLRTTT